MKGITICIKLTLFNIVCLNAQSPQFAVVRPDGTTFICPTWDSAYNKASDGDNIYLPGTSIALSSPFQINKQISVFGAGHYPDSTTATGKTEFVNSGLIIKKRVYLEGFYLNGGITVTDTTANNSTFIRLFLGGASINGTSGHYISQCIISQIGGNNPCNPINNILVTNSIFTDGAWYNVINSSFQNNVFLIPFFNSPPRYLTSANTTYTNNIFRGSFSFDWYYATPCFVITGNNFSNNVFTMSSTPGNNLGGNYFNVNSDSIFVNQTGGVSFSYTDNYHLKPNSPYLTAGSDGTQIGIYGGAAPYKEGAVPSNPHIYFRQVSTQTNPSGQLPVQIKVRTTN